MRTALIFFASLTVFGMSEICFAPPVVPPSQPLNILFYGNSYTLANGGVDRVVRDLAQFSGRPIPYTLSAAISGFRLQDHLESNLGPITSLPANANWDFVVMQDYSTLPTRVGNVPLHIASACDLFNSVATRSPGVTPVMFQTWARRADNSLFYGEYNPWFPLGPSQMQRDLRNSYLASSQAIDDQTWVGRSRVAWVGDAWEVEQYANLHIADQSHPGGRGTFLAGLVIFSAIYQVAPISLDAIQAASRLGINSTGASELIGVAQEIYDRPRPVFTNDPPPPPPPAHCVAADFNQDGLVSPDDLDEFITEYFSLEPSGGAPRVDFNNDGVVSPDDMDEFVTAYFSIC